MKEESLQNLSKFQIKLLTALANKYDNFLLIISAAVVISIAIAVISLIVYPKIKEPVLRGKPAVTFAVGAGFFTIPIYLYFYLVKIIRFGFLIQDVFPLFVLFSVYFFPLYIILMKIISFKRGPYEDNIEKDTLILGIREGDFGEKVINPNFIKLKESALRGDLHIIGGKGSGKTTTFVMPSLQQIFTDTSKSRPCVFLEDIKGVLADSVDAMEHPRKDDVMIIGYKGIAGNLLDMTDPELTANNLMLAFKNYQSGDVHEFFHNYASRFLENTLLFLDYFNRRDRGYDIPNLDHEHGHLIKPFFDFKAVTLVEVYNWVAEFDLKNYVIGYVEENRDTTGYFDPKIYECIRYFKKALRDDEGHLLSLINMISPLISEKVRKYFASPEPFDFVDAINKGKIIIVNVPTGTLGTIAKLIGLVLLLQMQKAAIKRVDSSFKIDRSRLIYIILDEVQEFMCSELAVFPAISRQAKVCNMYLHQSLGQIPEKFSDALFGNTLTKIALYVRDNQTANYLSENFGEKIVRKEMQSESKQGGVQRPGQIGAGTIKSYSKSFREEKERRFSPHDILHLPKNTAVFSRFDGGQLLESYRANLMPFYLEENDLFPVYHFIYRIKKDLSAKQISKLKKILKKTAKDINAVFKRFDKSYNSFSEEELIKKSDDFDELYNSLHNSFYFIFAFKQKTEKALVNSVFSSINKGMSKLKIDVVDRELFQGDLDTVVGKKADYGI